MSGPPPTSPPSVRPPAAHDAAGDVARWGAFSCVLVPVVLVGYGTSLAGACGTALGLAAVTGACRLLLRRSERGAARQGAGEHAPPRGRPGAADPGARAAEWRTDRNTPVG
ncbi:hypothetical protein GCM10010358_18550 [Streptomyces minutiscleroticus]|uniref:Uncharacterized protein n=1 Tax=Streptomyces minutiscleroticus TaxID=68238 RepID=A0A918NFX2_9ACTN|nr:hypothetical protein [Streptomyces minutiscleroticus]GGX64533.1 hypothetical protein GCM10010358_18550 [Streptomyces minutiscleroticus]